MSRMVSSKYRAVSREIRSDLRLLNKAIHSLDVIYKFSLKVENEIKDSITRNAVINAGALELHEKLSRIPPQVYCHNKPEIDKKRLTAWKRARKGCDCDSCKPEEPDLDELVAVLLLSQVKIVHPASKETH